MPEEPSVSPYRANVYEEAVKGSCNGTHLQGSCTRSAQNIYPECEIHHSLGICDKHDAVSVNRYHNSWSFRSGSTSAVKLYTAKDNEERPSKLDEYTQLVYEKLT